MAHFIESEIGRSSVFETVMYLGYPDLRTFIVLIALYVVPLPHPILLLRCKHRMKTGHKARLLVYQNHCGHYLTKY